MQEVSAAQLAPASLPAAALANVVSIAIDGQIVASAKVPTVSDSASAAAAGEAIERAVAGALNRL